MKKTNISIPPILIIFYLFFPIDGFAQQQNKEDGKYCSVLKDGIMLLIKDGIVHTNQITLQDGSILSKDGTVIRKDGSNIILKNGECIDMDGSIENISLEKTEQKSNIIQKRK